MENKIDIIASTSGTDNHSVDKAVYISREVEKMKLAYPNLDDEVVKRYCVDKYNRNKRVFDSLTAGESKLYKRIYLFGDSVLESHFVVKKFIADNRFFVETKSPWMLDNGEFDVSELLTKEEL